MNEEVISIIEHVIKDDGSVDGEKIMSLYTELNGSDNDISQIAAYKLHDILKVKQVNKVTYIAIISFILLIRPSEDIVLECIDYALRGNDFSYSELYFLYTRMSRVAFISPCCNTDNVNIGLWKLIRKSLEVFKSNTCLDLTPIPNEDLNGSVPIVLTTQFLSTEHGPTKTALDRAIILKKRFGNVLLINTAEVLTEVGSNIYFENVVASYDESLLDKEFVEWKGEKIPYFQCEKNMPDVDTMALLLSTIRKMKPKVCVSVGGNSFFAGLVNEIIPTVVVGTTQSNLMHTLCDYQIADIHQMDVDRNVIKKVSCEDSLIEGKFTFSIEQIRENVNKKQFNIPEDSFVICMVGGRLNIECSDELWSVLSELEDENICIIMIGIFGKKDELCSRYPKLACKVRDLGLCTDAVSKIAMSDLYVNPVRKGGATSAVEALSLGIPVVTLNYGDVAGSVGTDFCCSQLTDYTTLIKRYIHDKDFYHEKSRIAIETSKGLLDSEREFNRVIDEYLKLRDKRYKRI